MVLPTRVPPTRLYRYTILLRLRWLDKQIARPEVPAAAHTGELAERHGPAFWASMHSERRSLHLRWFRSARQGAAAPLGGEEMFVRVTRGLLDPARYDELAGIRQDFSAAIRALPGCQSF